MMMAKLKYDDDILTSDMTPEELIEQVQSESLTVIAGNKYMIPNTKDYYQMFTAYYLDNGVVKSESFIIYVHTDEQGNQIAYFKDTIPYVLRRKQMPFPVRIRKLIDEKRNEIGADIVAIEQVDDVGKCAIVRIIRETDTGAEERRLLVKEVEGKLTIKDVTSSIKSLSGVA